MPLLNDKSFLLYIHHFKVTQITVLSIISAGTYDEDKPNEEFSHYEALKEQFTQI